MKFKINQKIIHETNSCHNRFICIDGDVSHGGEVKECEDGITCCEFRRNNEKSEFCYYRLQFELTDIICGCPVRGEIFRKYSV